MKTPRRMVQVQLQRWIPQIVTIDVAVPEDWTDDRIKQELSHIYEESEPDTHSWMDMDDFDPREGTHELTGEVELQVRPDLVYPPEPDDDDE